LEDEKEKIGKDQKENNKEERKEINKLENKVEKEENSVNNEINENSDIINNNNLNKLKNLNDYKITNDINIINNIGIKKKESNALKEENIIKENDEEQNKGHSLKIDNNINNNIKKEKEAKDKKEKEENNIDNDNNKKENNKNKEYSYKEISQITESNIFPEELIAYNISQGSELFLNEVIDKLGGYEENNSIKDNLNNTSNINDNIIKEIDSDSVKIDSKEDLKLCLTNIPTTDEKSDISQITNELNKACIRTNDNIKSNLTSNIDLSIPREEEKEEPGKNYKKISKKDTKNSNNINEDKKTIEMLFNNQEPKKDESALIEETKKEIYNEIDNMYENKLNLVKIIRKNFHI
jgi:hypothetical protein